jgi:hypothetical protein
MPETLTQQKEADAHFFELVKAQPIGDTRSHTIMKFLGNLPTEPTIKQSTLFFAEIIDVVIPLIETSLASEGGDEH